MDQAVLVGRWCVRLENGIVEGTIPLATVQHYVFAAAVMLEYTNTALADRCWRALEIYAASGTE